MLTVVPKLRRFNSSALIFIFACSLLLVNCAQLPQNLDSSIAKQTLNPTLASQFQPPLASSHHPKNSLAKPIIKDGLEQRTNTSLNQAISLALLENPQIIEQQALVAQAIQQVRISRAEQAFNLSLASASSIRHDPLNSGAKKNFKLDLNASLPLDIWGNLQNNQQVVHYQLAIAKANLQQAKQQLVAAITSAWYQLIYHTQDAQLRQQQEENTRHQLAAIESAYNQGLKQSLDVYLARENLAAASAQVLVQAQNLASSARRLELLLSKYPSGKFRVSGALAKLSDDFLLGVPADLLVNRADINSRWLAVLAEDANVAARYAQRFPQFNLSGNFSLTSARLADLFKQNLAWTLIANISQSVIDSGKKAALHKQSKAQLIVREQQYLYALQNALEEVENLLDSAKSIQVQQLLKQRALDNAQHALAQVKIQYQHGIADYQQVLSIQNRVYSHQQALLEQHMQRISNRVDLLLALGS
ncbi:MAG: hypothetical protein OFPII_27490 [Osedax symbiont Rs1]|nr:MAG: hypothetical protein OFPII_27490 [Osedax symbiont Rs1]